MFAETPGESTLIFQGRRVADGDPPQSRPGTEEIGLKNARAASG
jgi:hypothetical protein